MTESPPRTATEVTVRWWRLEGERPDPADLALLDDGERERLSDIGHPARAAEFAGSRAGTRRVLSDLLDVGPAEIGLGRLPCPGCGDPRHGPPAVVRPSSPFRISLSHSAGCCVLAVARVPVGVDVEGVRTLDTEELARVALTAAELRHVRDAPAGMPRSRAFLRCWTRKEAVLKAVGIGLAADLTRIETHPGLPDPVTVAAGVPGTPATWSVRGLSLPPDWIATVALPHGVRTDVTVLHHHRSHEQIRQPPT
ncbi:MULTISPECIES: 4'-phosphopantetheinyl transferase family protein [unclassified Streptomyces]|uniref:4'-phosphopantetheinyl transferase family protein n=1 Tax=unclassified Streptomyces TaxID=2593676 RepID=UPI002DD87578|nr:4'-phosphopantetheinyl transferase superfamily protein [Streptomyces sp. NBC_01237]WRZ73424.1 4'-phosphopantetheinyl transferase superfamily protein [Streptomyces sp. NBC_01237]